MWNLKYGTDELTYKTETDSERTLAVDKGDNGGWGKGWTESLGLVDTNYIEWINNEVLLYSTSNYIQSPGINYNEKEYKKRMYICV